MADRSSQQTTIFGSIRQIRKKPFPCFQMNLVSSFPMPQIRKSPSWAVFQGWKNLILRRRQTVRLSSRPKPRPSGRGERRRFLRQAQDTESIEVQYQPWALGLSSGRRQTPGFRPGIVEGLISFSKRALKILKTRRLNLKSATRIPSLKMTRQNI